MVDITKYLRLMCDPITRQPLELEWDARGVPSLVCKAADVPYPFVGDFPDLRRPDAGVPTGCSEIPGGLPTPLMKAQNEVAAHYNRKPSHSYLNLDYLPLGAWLRDPQYATWFEKIEFGVEVGAGKRAIAAAFKTYRNVRLFCVDLAYLVLAKVRGRFVCPDLKVWREQFGNIFLTPFARFHVAEEMISLGGALGLRLVVHQTGGWTNNRFAHFDVFEEPEVGG
jgi:uncharacterized protein YbaR (Trm112 family)